MLGNWRPTKTIMGTEDHQLRVVVVFMLRKALSLNLTSFSHVTSANVRIIPQNVLTFSFTLFVTLV